MTIIPLYTILDDCTLVDAHEFGSFNLNDLYLQLLWISTSKCLLVHAFACLKTIKKHLKMSTNIFIIHMSCTWDTHVEKKNKKQQNSKWATSIWVSTSFWESLPIADQQTFFFVFLREPYMSLSCAWWKRYFLLVFECIGACVHWSKYTTSNL